MNFCSLRKDKARSTAMPLAPKGCVAVIVGHEGQVNRRFIVPVMHVNHPLFMKLLAEAEEEYGFEQKGAIVIPCDIEKFLQVQDAIDNQVHCQEHHHQYKRQISHPHLPHFAAACLGFHD